MTSPSNARELAIDIETRITAGELQPGDRLEPVRRVADRLGLAPNTVAAAYRTLGARGLVHAEGRRGTFVAHRPPVAMPRSSSTTPRGDLVDLATGNPDLALLPDLAPVLAAISAEPVAYEHPSVDAALRRLLVDDFAADGVPADELCVVGGALDGIERILTSHLRPGDRVAFEDPGYASVAELVVAMGFRPVGVAIDEAGPRLDALADALGAGVEAVVVTPRAQNPTGAALDEVRAEALRRELGSAAQTLVILDDHAGAVAGVPFHHVVEPDHPRWAVVRSVAKSLGPDLRLAGLAGDPTTVARVAGRQALGTGWVSHLLQRTVAHLLASPEVTELLGRAAASYEERRRVVVDILGEAGIEARARSGLNVWVPVDDEASVVAAMQAEGYRIRSGARYRIRSAPGVRVSVGSGPVDVLRDAASALVDVLAPERPARTA